VSAELQLTTCGEGCRAEGSVGLFPALESWTEGDGAGTEGDCATWNCRVDGVSWSVPGCGYLSGRNRSREGAAAAVIEVPGPGARLTADVTALVRGWMSDPEANRGLALVADEEAIVDLVAHEAPADLGARPRLLVTLRLDDEGPPVDAGVDAGSDAGADAGVRPEMVEVPRGDVVMGCDVGECEADELPLHRVTISAFSIDRTEVTQGAYEACVAAGTCAEPTCAYDPGTSTDYPVACVRHADAADYCAFVDKRLPTEAEWERAARGNDRRYPWGNQKPDCTRANAFGCAGQAQPVDLHPDGDSPFGAADMAGNVSEYVADFYDPGYYAVSPAIDPPGPPEDNAPTRIRRGGAYSGGDETLATFDRIQVGPNVRADNIGFRCARDAADP
jgi:formylglycine-generating enzyme required for sulfatase activity